MKLSLLTKFYLSTLVVFFGAFALLNAQPASVSIESATLYQHGRNSGGITAFENIDSVTLGSTTKYYVLPDAAVNASFNVITNPFDNVISTFNWTVPVALATGQDDTVPAYPTASHYKQVTWTGLGADTIRVTETSAVAVGGCTGLQVKTPVRVIAAPDITSVTIGNATCQTTPISVACPNATLGISCVVNGNKGVEIAYSITGPAGFTSINGTANLNNSNALTLSGHLLDRAGAYTLTITTVTDRIAKKCGLLAIAETAAATFYVTPTPKTGTTLHVPNVP